MRPTLVTAAILGLGGAVAFAARPTPGPPAAVEARIREADLRFYLARAERDPRGALDLAHAASLLAERGRSAGTAADLAEAESLARRALANQPGQPFALRV
ncbi:MAG TPA: hypothetical protein VJ773_05000, partial [Gemmatimonadales bacterium]|nr:hypothetical protein [Gemmatimonadales bacterium]